MVKRNHLVQDRFCIILFPHSQATLIGSFIFRKLMCGRVQIE